MSCTSAKTGTTVQHFSIDTTSAWVKLANRVQGASCSCGLRHMIICTPGSMSTMKDYMYACRVLRQYIIQL